MSRRSSEQEFVRAAWRFVHNEYDTSGEFVVFPDHDAHELTVGSLGLLWTVHAGMAQTAASKPPALADTREWDEIALRREIERRQLPPCTDLEFFALIALYHYKAQYRLTAIDQSTL